MKKIALKIALIFMCIINILIFIDCVLVSSMNIKGEVCYPHKEIVKSLEGIIVVLSFIAIILPIILPLIKSLQKKHHSKKTKDYSLLFLIIHLIPIILFATKIAIKMYDENYNEMQLCHDLWEFIPFETEE